MSTLSVVRMKDTTQTALSFKRMTSRTRISFSYSYVLSRRVSEPKPPILDYVWRSLAPTTVDRSQILAWQVQMRGRVIVAIRPTQLRACSIGRSRRKSLASYCSR